MPDSRCMADFRVFASGVSTFYSGEAARYQVDEGGVLTVFDGKGTRFQLSPSGWLSVEDQPELDIPDVESPSSTDTVASTATRGGHQVHCAGEV
jgi:hypothetical protein